ncbi:MAG: DoxX family protein [Flavobacteriales bacterium]|nr:DoxX family protein [Flavobacteriales bacterium]
MKTIYNKISDFTEVLKDVPLLLMRLVLAYGFYEPAMMKINSFESIVEWFEGMGLPFARLNAYMATGTEFAGFILLTLGLFTRAISAPLVIVMLVAIKTVHLANGFQAGSNGYEIPLYYMIMLFTLIIYGPGRFSLDRIIKLD